MSAELAMLSSVKSGVNKLGAALRPASVITAETSDYAIVKNEAVFVGLDGKIYPTSVINGEATLTVGTDDSKAYQCVPISCQLGGGFYATTDSSSSVQIMKYDEETELFVVGSAYNLGDAYNFPGYTYLKWLKEGVFAIYYNVSSSVAKVSLVLYDEDYKITEVVAGNDITHNSYSVRSSIMMLDATRLCVTAWNDHIKFNVFELATDNKSFVSQSVNNASGDDDFFGNLAYPNVLDYAMTGADITHIAYGSRSATIRVSDSSGTGINKENKADVYNKYALAFGSFGSQHYSIPYDADSKETLLFCRYDNGVDVSTESKMVRFSSNSDGELVETSYDLPFGLPHARDGINFPRYVRFNATTWYGYAPYTAAVGYLHCIFKLTLNDETNTCVIEQIYLHEYSDTTTSHAQYSSMGLLSADGGKFLTSCFTASKVNESISIPLAGVDAQLIDAITIEDIAENSSGKIYVNNNALPVDNDAGTPFAKDYTTLTTQYAVKNK